VNSEDKSKIRNMRFKGETYAKIARVIGVSANTIKSFCRRNNLQNLDADECESKNICKNCSVQFDNIRSNKKFCSDKCRLIWWSKNSDKLRKTAVYNLECKHCGKNFESYGNDKRLFCSRPCYFSHRYSVS